MSAQSKDNRMMADNQQRPGRLGRGLAALIGDIGPAETAAANSQGMPERTPRKVPIAFLRANPRNPRKAFAADAIAELAESIRQKGIIQPIIVRAVAGATDEYEIVAGERRWRAAQRAGLHDVPIIVHELDDREALEIAIVENVQRTDLDPVEEAMGYEQLIAEFSYTQDALSKVIGKSRSHVANTLRLLKLPESVKEHLRSGRLSAGHARTLVTSDHPEELADRIINEGMNVREAESAARKGEAKPRAKAAPEATAKDADTLALEKAISDVIGLDLKVAHRPTGGGTVTVSYRTLEQLDFICNRLKGGRAD